MDYKKKYHKYKALYLNMKTNMHGGVDGKGTDDSSVIEEVTTTANIYANKIANLKKLVSCKKELTLDEIKHNLKSMYNNIGQQTMSFLGITDMFQGQESAFKDINWRTIRDKICDNINNKVIPLLEKQRSLYDKFLDASKNIQSRIRQEDIERYIDFATINDMLDKSPKEILLALQSKLTTEIQKIQQISRADLIEDETKSFQHELTASKQNPVLSKNGHQCNTNGCLEAKNTIFGTYHYCYTEKPYKTWTGSHDWDYC